MYVCVCACAFSVVQKSTGSCGGADIALHCLYAAPHRPTTALCAQCAFCMHAQHFHFPTTSGSAMRMHTYYKERVSAIIKIINNNNAVSKWQHFNVDSCAKRRHSGLVELK